MGKQAGKSGKISAYSNAAGEVQFYVVELVPIGYVVIAADDEWEPIIAFSHSDQFAAQPGNPLFDLLQKDTEGRTRQLHAAAAAHGTSAPGHARRKAKWELLAASLSAQTAAASLTQGPVAAALGVATLNDVRVDPLIQSRWSQSAIWNGSSYVAGYNYYTPPNAPGNANNYVSGCVATAWAQIMRFHQWPATGVGTNSFAISVDGVSRAAALRGGDGAGGPYDWANMVLAPGSATTALQRQAIGALLYDAGVADNMAYTQNASSAYLHTAAIKNVFHYANAANSTGGLADITLAIRTNLDAGWPVALSILATTGAGHEVVCDGYGFNLGTLYHHLNLGWGGMDDSWYNLPEVDTESYTFDTVTGATYNIHPTMAGEIISGRVTDFNGSPVPGVVVTAAGPSNYSATTNQRGIFAIKGLPSRTTWVVSQNGGAAVFGPAQVTVTTGSSADRSPVGDRIVDDFQTASTTSAPSFAGGQPSNQTVAAGSNASFTVVGLGTPAPTLQWQVSTSGGNSWTNLTNSAPYSGTTTGTLTITGATTSLSGDLYRCLASNATQSNVASNAATLTVVNKTAGTVTLSGLSAVYNGASHAAAATTAPSGLAVTFTYNGSATVPTNAGSYTVVGTISDANYQGAATGTLLIGKAPLTAKADDKSKVEGTANPTLTVTYTGFVNGETATVVGTPPTIGTIATKSSVAGTYPITLAGGSAANYALSLQNGTLTVNVTDQTFLKQLFLDALGRQIDPGALASFGAALAGGEARADVLSDIFATQEYALWQIEPAIRLYYAALARCPDYVGLQNWCNALHSGALTLTGAGDQFASSAEFLLKYGNLDNAGYVQQLYLNVLGRQADPAGLANWVARLDGGASRGAVLTGFSESPEFQTDMANPVEIIRLYYLLLHRMPTAAELQTWLGFLQGNDQTDALFAQGFPAGLDPSNYVQLVFQGFLRQPADSDSLGTFANALTAGTASHGSLVSTLLTSADFNTYVAPVSRLYLAAFRRVPDAPGLDNWVSYARAGNSLQSAADAFVASTEFQLTYGSLDDGQYVTLLYENVLGREPDPTGLANWVDQLGAGATRGQVLIGFSESKEGIGLFAPTVRTFLHYFTFLNSTPAQSDLDYWENYLTTLDGQMRDDLLADPTFTNGG
jgi:hypothetical protein